MEKKNTKINNLETMDEMKIFFIAVISKKAYVMHNLFMNIKLVMYQCT